MKSTIYVAVILGLFWSVLAGAGNSPEDELPCLSESEILSLIRNAPAVADPEASARMLFYRENWSIKSSTSVSSEKEVLLEILSDKARHEQGDIKIHRDIRFTSATVDCATTYLSDGTRIPIMEGADNELTHPAVGDAPAYSDLMTRIVSFSGVEKGAFLHYRVTLESSYPPNEQLLWNSFNLQYELPVEHLEISIQYPDHTPVQYRLYNGAEPPETISHAGHTVLCWRRTHVPAVPVEWSMPPVSNQVPGFRVTAVKDWDQLGEWFRGIFFSKSADDVLAIGSDMPNLKSLHDDDDDDNDDDDDDPRTRIDRCFRFVADNVRTIPLSAGVRGYRPGLLGEIISRGYGDVLDKAAILGALLTNQGIQWEIAMLPEAGDSRPADVPSLSDYPGIAVVAILPYRQEIWLDPDSRNARPGLLFRGDDVWCIRFGDGAARPAKLPVVSPEMSVCHRVIEMTLDDAGSLSGTMNWQGSGFFETQIRNRFRDMTIRQQQMEIDRDLSNVVFPIEVHNMHLPDWDSFSSLPEISLDWVSPQAASQGGDLLVLPLTDIPLHSGRMPVPVTQDRRQQPVQLSYTGIENIRMIVTFPGSYEVIYCPESQTHSFESMDVVQHVEKSSDMITIDRRLLWKQSTVSPLQYANAFAGYARFAKASENIVILKRVTN